jgi:hypothetical protein
VNCPLTGSPVVAAAVAPGNLGKPAGSASQISPHDVVVRDGSPEAVGRGDAIGLAADGPGDGDALLIGGDALLTSGDALLAGGEMLAVGLQATTARAITETRTARRMAMP